MINGRGKLNCGPKKKKKKMIKKVFQFNRESNLAEEENVLFEINLNGNKESGEISAARKAET